MKSTVPLILGFFWVVAGRTAAQVNLLPQGNFEAPGVNTEWAEGFNLHSAHPDACLSEFLTYASPAAVITYATRSG